MENIKLQFIAWLRKRGFKPHSSNLLHLKAGFILGFLAACITFVVFLICIKASVWSVIVPACMSIVVGFGAGYWKEKLDGNDFDMLDFLSTGVGGVLGAIFFIVYFFLAGILLQALIEFQIINPLNTLL